MLSLNDFVSQSVGKCIDRWGNPDGSIHVDPYGCQCVVLSNAWCANLGIERFAGNAADFVGDPHPDCDWIPNTPAAVPQPGDIMVWGAWPGNPYGHTSVLIAATPTAFTSLDQNWVNSGPNGSRAAKVTHNYLSPYVAGWYNPRLEVHHTPARMTDMQNIFIRDITADEARGDQPFSVSGPIAIPGRNTLANVTARVPTVVRFWAWKPDGSDPRFVGPVNVGGNVPDVHGPIPATCSPADFKMTDGYGPFTFGLEILSGGPVNLLLHDE